MPGGKPPGKGLAAPTPFLFFVDSPFFFETSLYEKKQGSLRNRPGVCGSDRSCEAFVSVCKTTALDCTELLQHLENAET